MHDHVIRFGCDFLVPGVALPQGPGFHRIELSWDRRHPENGGKLQIDPNSCGLDEFGDTTICTKIAVRLQDIRLKLLKEKDGKQAYEIDTLLDPQPAGSTDP